MTDDPSSVAAIAAVASVIVAWLNNRQGRKLHAQGEEIHALVNSNLTAVKADLALALSRVAALEALIKEIRSAQSVKQA